MTRKPRVMLNLNVGIYRWFRSVELATGLSRSRLGEAAICALRLLSDKERQEVVQWAKLLDEGCASWDDFGAAADRLAKERARAVKRVAARALAAEVAEYPRAKPKAPEKSGGRGS